jgi:hypothetical protein
MEGDDENENDSDDAQKPKEILTPLQKYVTRLGGGKGGGTTKFACHHCHTTYTGSYTRVRKHLCGLMHWDEGKTVGVKTCVQVPPKDRIQCQRGEKAAQNKSKKTRVEHESSQECSSVDPHPPMLVDSLLRLHIQGVKLYQISLTKVVEMMWILKISGFSMHVVYHSIFFAHPIGLKWVQAINGDPKGYKSPGYDKDRTLGLDRERAKIHVALGKITNAWNHHGVSILSNSWTNVKGRPLINIIGVLASGAVLLLARDYSDRYKTSINIPEPLIKIIQEIGV